MSVPNIIPDILKIKVKHIHGKTCKHQYKAWNGKSVSASVPLFTTHNDLLLQRTAVKSFFCPSLPKIYVISIYTYMYKWFSKYYQMKNAV